MLVRGNETNQQKETKAKQVFIEEVEKGGGESVIGGGLRFRLIDCLIYFECSHSIVWALFSPAHFYLIFSPHSLRMLVTHGLSVSCIRGCHLRGQRGKIPAIITSRLPPLLASPPPIPFQATPIPLSTPLSPLNPNPGTTSHSIPNNKTRGTWAYLC